MKFGEITDTQRRVLDLLALGCTDYEIALATNLSKPTVKYHVDQIVQKLNARDRTHAVFKGFKYNLLSRTRPIDVPEFVLAAMREKGATP